MTWTYQGTVERLVDGDTLVVSVDMGMDVWRLHQHLRIAHMNAPELSTPEGKAALTYAQTLVKPGDVVGVLSRRWDKYGRLLADVKCAGGEDYATAMLTSGHAVAYEG